MLSRVAKIELEYGNLRRFQVATAVDKATKPDFIEKAVEPLTKLRTMHFGDTILNAGTQHKIRNLRQNGHESSLVTTWIPDTMTQY